MHNYKNNVMKLIYSQRGNFILYFANRRVLNSYYVHFRIMCRLKAKDISHVIY